MTSWLPLALAIATATLSAQAPASAQLVIASAAPGDSGESLTITGQNFGPRPFVTLDLIPLNLQAASGTAIVASVPVREMPAGEYLLTVSRGPSAVETASFQLVLGGGQTNTAQAATTAGAPSNAAAPADAPRSPFASSAEPAAKVGDRVITIAEVDRAWQQSEPAAHIAMSRELYAIRRRAVDKMIADELIAREAAARGLTPQALLDQEIPKRVITLPESSVVALYQSLGDRTRGTSLEQMRPALRAWLAKHTEPEIAKMSYVEELMKVSTKADVLLLAPRVEVERTAQDVALGPAAAPIEIVAFGDFQSRQYAWLAQAIPRVRETFGDRVRFVFKNLPSLGPESIEAAVAAQCANAQGKFWPYHDSLIVQPDAISTNRLRQSAAAVKMNLDAYDTCVESGKFRDAIRQAMDEAGRYALSTSPSFLVNGRLAEDPPPFLPPFDFFKRIIEQELSRLNR